MKYNKGFAPVLIALLVAGVLVIGGGAYYWGKSSKINDKENLDNKENLTKDIETNSINGNLSLYKNDSLSFYYPNNWKIETLRTKNDKNIQIILDPIKVFTPQEIKGLDVSMGMITFSVNNDSTEKNSFVIGYESFPTITIGVNKIKAKMFEKFYPKDAPEVSAQGEHHITYYIDENIEINYRSEKDTYLKDFNQLMNSLELNSSSKELSEKQIGYINSNISEESSTETFRNQPGAIKSIKSNGTNKWIFAVDLLSGNPNWEPGVDSTGPFFLNKNTKIRNLNISNSTKIQNCTSQNSSYGSGFKNDPLSFVTYAQDRINKAKTDPKSVEDYGFTAYFDINGTTITAIYEQCLP